MIFALLLHWVLIVGALTYIITRSSIASPIRVVLGAWLYQWPTLRGFIRSLIYCAACTGFWVGAACARDWPFDGPWWSRILGSGLAGITIGTLWNRLWPPIYEYEAAAWGDEEEDDAASQEETEDGE